MLHTNKTKVGESLKKFCNNAETEIRIAKSKGIKLKAISKGNFYNKRNFDTSEF
jgi:hypothetical protein